MISIFQYREYKPFLKEYIASQPRGGRGLLTQIAAASGLSPAMLSQILSGDKHFSPEAAYEVGQFLALDEAELSYLLTLLQFARAGSHGLRERYRREVAALQKSANEISKKLKADAPLSETARALFYSHWLYTGIRNLTACPDFKDIDKIAAHLKIPRTQAQRVIDFLVDQKLCVMDTKGQLAPGPQITHIGNETSLVYKHHQNWRLHALTKMFDVGDRNMFFTSPMSLSHEAADLIRQRLPAFIEEIRKIVGPSESEVVRCLNIDWFEY